MRRDVVKGAFILSVVTDWADANHNWATSINKNIRGAFGPSTGERPCDAPNLKEAVLVTTTLPAATIMRYSQ